MLNINKKKLDTLFQCRIGNNVNKYTPKNNILHKKNLYVVENTYNEIINKHYSESLENEEKVEYYKKYFEKLKTMQKNQINSF